MELEQGREADRTAAQKGRDDYYCAEKDGGEDCGGEGGIWSTDVSMVSLS